jgi:hypothetical protein
MNIGVRSGSIDIADRKLNAAVALLEPWFRKWWIKINTQKSTITLFNKRSRQYRRSPCPVIISAENITWTSVTFDSKLSYKTHISCILLKANNSLRQIFPILNKSSIIDINLALIIYKPLLRSILTYASPVWGYAAKTYMNKLQTFQNKVLGIITKLPSVTPILTLHEQTGMPLIRSRIRKVAGAVYQKSANSDNSLMKEIGHYDLIVTSICVPYLSRQVKSLRTATFSNSPRTN